MPAKYNIVQLTASAGQRPQGFVDFILEYGKTEGDFVLLDDATVVKLRERFPPAPVRAQPTTARYNLAHLKATATERPEGYVDFVLKHGKLDGDFVALDEAGVTKLREKFPPPPPRSQPLTARYNIAHLKAAAAERPTGYVDFVLQRGKIEDGFVILEEAQVKELREKFPPPPVQIKPPEMRFQISHLKATAELRPEGLVDFVLAKGKITGDFAVLDTGAIKELREKFGNNLGPKPPPEPTVAEMASNFTKAMAGWAKAGFKVVKRKVYEKRHAICLTCEYWDAKARGGLGKCNKCGCSRSKLWLATSHCPLNPPKWKREDG